MSCKEVHNDVYMMECAKQLHNCINVHGDDGGDDGDDGDDDDEMMMRMMWMVRMMH